MQSSTITVVSADPLSGGLQASTSTTPADGGNRAEPFIGSSVIMATTDSGIGFLQKAVGIELHYAAAMVQGNTIAVAKTSGQTRGIDSEGSFPSVINSLFVSGNQGCAGEGCNVAIFQRRRRRLSPAYEPMAVIE